MASDFIQVTDEFWVAPQLHEADIERAAKEGFSLIINNRPDGEVLGQPSSNDLKAEAIKNGIQYVHIPVGAQGITDDHLAAHLAARDASPGKAVAFCRTGTRSIFLGAYAAVSAGESVEEVIKLAAAAGYDISGHRAALQEKAEKSQG